MAAHAAMLGLDPWLVLNCHDQTEFTIMEAIVNRGVELLERRDRNLAIDISNRIAKQMSG